MVDMTARLYVNENDMLNKQEVKKARRTKSWKIELCSTNETNPMVDDIHGDAYMLVDFVVKMIQWTSIVLKGK